MDIFIALEQSLTQVQPVVSPEVRLVGTVIGMAILVITALLAYLPFYLYTSFAYLKIAQKTKTSKQWLAWIPIARNVLLSKIAKMSSWPAYLLIPIIISILIVLVSLKSEAFPLIVIFSVPLILILGAIFLAFWIVWHWKIFTHLNRPGWWSIVFLIPTLGPILYLIFIGIAAFSNSKIKKKRMDKSVVFGIISIITFFPILPLTIIFYTFITGMLSMVLGLFGLNFRMNQGSIVVQYIVILIGSYCGYLAVANKNKSKNSKILGSIGLILNLGYFLLTILL